MNDLCSITSAEEIASFLGVEICGENIEISGVCSINKPKSDSITFLEYSKKGTFEEERMLILVPLDFSKSSESHNTIIRCKKPRLAYAQIVSKFFFTRSKPTISRSAIISPDVKIGKNVYIGNNVVIEEACEIGDNTEVMHSVVILKKTKIGNNCRIAPGVVIGDDGLGSLKDEKGKLIALRHVGGVEIGDFVEIGANSTVARGTIDDTVVCKFNKIGPQVNIGHNSFIDENCEIAGRTHISGSVFIGKNCFLGANCTLKESIKIAEQSLIGIGAVVTKDVLQESKLMGLEALPLRKLAAFKHKFDYK